MGYKHISQTEPYRIQALMIAGQTQTGIAQILECHKSTISRDCCAALVVVGAVLGKRRTKQRDDIIAVVMRFTSARKFGAW
jgi:hypothetical protein